MALSGNWIFNEELNLNYVHGSVYEQLKLAKLDRVSEQHAFVLALSKGEPYIDAARDCVWQDGRWVSGMEWAEQSRKVKQTGVRGMQTAPQKLFAPDFNYGDPSIDYLTITRRFRNFGDE